MSPQSRTGALTADASVPAGRGATFVLSGSHVRARPARRHTHVQPRFLLTPPTRVIFSDGQTDARDGSHAASTATPTMTTHRRSFSARGRRRRRPMATATGARAAERFCAANSAGRRCLFVAFGDQTRDERHDTAGSLLFSILAARRAVCRCEIARRRGELRYLPHRGRREPD